MTCPVHSKVRALLWTKTRHHLGHRSSLPGWSRCDSFSTVICSSQNSFILGLPPSSIGHLERNAILITSDSGGAHCEPNVGYHRSVPSTLNGTLCNSSRLTPGYHVQFSVLSCRRVPVNLHPSGFFCPSWSNPSLSNCLINSLILMTFSNCSGSRASPPSFFF